MSWLLLVLGTVLVADKPPSHQKMYPASMINTWSGVAPGAWIVNEIHFAPPDNALEFIEIINTTDASRDLCALTFSDNRDQAIPACESSLFIPPGVPTVIARDRAAFDAAFPGVPVVEPPSWPALNNGGDAVRLYLDGSTLIEEVMYDPSWGAPGASLERIDPAGPSNASFNWASSLDPRGATPGERNSRYAPDLLPPSLLFAEQTNPRLLTTHWTEPLDESGVDPSLFRVGDQSPGALTLRSPATVLLHFGADVAGSILHFEGVRDQTGNTTGPANHPVAQIPTPGELVINEILFEPRADPFDGLPDQPEYVEFLSRSSRTLSLRSITLTGYTDENNQADTLRSTAPYPILPPRSIAVLYAAGSTVDSDLKDLLQTAFPDIDSSSLRLPVRQTSLRLDNGGDIVRLVVDGSVVLEELTFSAAWHHPNLAVTRGFSLERRSPDVSARLASNWSTSLDARGGTPGRSNSLFAAESIAPRASRVQAAPNPFSPDGDGIDDILFINLPMQNTPQFIRMTVFDARGRQRRLLTPGSLAGPGETFLWDGVDDAGLLLPAGLYIILVEDLQPLAGRQTTYKMPVILARPLDE